ncbi:hypothetical protein EXIGLDRAFT_762764 [Exidia glandulosa HHB12029]|uniref:Uncharacterized protein n=1 Tax=Exidia glandulosa HHB12029 TaxID=1314781 RepID=A0A165MGJ3_EXIGL|nr:hypothetical protein EXIGLDRAFT_762762 [Exidia glandulosa HHB12029]KZV99232.1 hypothetical protein EXIGLDRAFT_762764 [Exidia glandulosa HHB12029]
MKSLALLIILALMHYAACAVIRRDLTFEDVLQAMEDMDEKCGADMDDSLHDAFDDWVDEIKLAAGATTSDPAFQAFLAASGDWKEALCECAEARDEYATLSASFLATHPQTSAVSTGSATVSTILPAPTLIVPAELACPPGADDDAGDQDDADETAEDPEDAEDAEDMEGLEESDTGNVRDDAQVDADQGPLSVVSSAGVEGREGPALGAMFTLLAAAVAGMTVF